MTRSRRTAFLCLFFISGACGLTYEIVWSRLLVFVFGGTTFAITTVLGCFMGGLALGSYLAGRVSHRIKHPARVYGMLEIGIGAYCLVLPLFFDLGLPMYRALARVSDQSFFWLSTARTLVCAAILILPTCLMGATLPLLSQAFVRRASGLGGAVARLYGINTIGAFVGCAGAGFLLLPVLGLSKSILLAAALNISAGFVAIVLTLRTDREADPTKAGTNRAKEAQAHLPRRAPSIRPGLLLLIYGVSGFAAMAYQVAWTRALILAIGASTYAFSAIVACFILGIALGSLFASRWLDRIPSPLAAAALLEAAIALSALLVVPLFGEMPGLVQRLSQSTEMTFEKILAVEALCVCGLLIVPTLCMGALMPLVCTVYEASRAAANGADAGDATRTRRAGVGRSVGDVYAANSLGTIAGSVVTGFLLIPWPLFGMQRTIVLASALSGIAATVFLVSQRPRRKEHVLAALPVLWLAGLILVSISQPWSRSTMVSGPYLGRPPSGESPDVRFYREGIDTTVAVTSLPDGTLSLRVNGKPDASNEVPDLRTMQLTGHVPLLLRPDAKDVCVIGLGSGVTTGAVLAHPVDRVDCAEISSAVIDAAVHFAEYSNHCLDDPRLTLVRADGRNFLLMGDRRYDVISSEPSNPWISGVANLFTREFFEIVKARLKPGGVHCQWLQAYSMKADDFAAVLCTVASVFEHIQLWHSSLTDYLIMCSDAPIVLDIERIGLTFQRPAVREMLRSIMINDPIQLAYHYVADGRDLTGLTKAQRPLTDDLPRLEFSAPRYLLRGESNEIERALCDIEGTPRLRGSADSPLNKQFLEALGRARRAKKVLNASRTVPTLEAGYECYRILTNYASEDWRIVEFMDMHMRPLYRVASADIKGKIGGIYAALSRLVPGIARGGRDLVKSRARFAWPIGQRIEPVSDPSYAEALKQAKALFDAGQKVAALKRARQVAERFPDDPTALQLTGAWALEVEGAAAAIPYLLRAVIVRPGDSETSLRLASAYTMQQDRDTALTVLEAAVENGLSDRTRLTRESSLGPLQDDERFQRLLTRMGDSKER